MFDAAVIDTTPVRTPLYSQTYADTPRTSVPITTLSVKAETAARGFQAPVLIRSGTGTVTLAEMRDASAASARYSPPQNSDDSVVERARNDRVTLLAQKYEGKISREGSARLEILTQRIRRLTPRVTAESVDNLARIIDDIDEVSVGLEALRNEFRF